jgi:hypothetical protein
VALLSRLARTNLVGLRNSDEYKEPKKAVIELLAGFQ